MNYYEELGIGPEATEQEIRKAHRRLVKLMHPDAQPDQNLKMLAETQMRRLNSIVSTLVDPEQRRSYDEELTSASHSANKQPLVPGFRGIPWWLASTVGAVVLTLVAVWLWADHMGNGIGTRTRVYISPADRTSVSEVPAVQSKPDAGTDSGNEIGSASYKAPLPAPQPSVNDGVSTAVVPDLPANTRAQTQEIAKPEIAKPEIAKKVGMPPARVPATQIKQVDSPPPKSAETRTVVARNSEPKVVAPPVVKQVVKQAPPLVAKLLAPDAAQKSSPKTATQTLVQTGQQPSPPSAPAPKKLFNLPAGSVIASTASLTKGHGQLPPPPGEAGPNTRDYNSSSLPPSSLPAATPPKLAVVTTAANSGSALMNPRDPLEGEWVYAPKEPEKRKAGFYPPEFIDLKLFGAGDPGNLKGQYSAKYVITDRPVSPEIAFELASVSKGSRKFVWQSSNGAKGTLSIDPIDEQTIRIDWHTTSAVGGPALTSGTATLVRRQ